MNLIMQQKNRRLWLFVVAMLCSIASWAWTDYNPGWNEISFDPKTGNITFEVRYYQSWGASGDGHCAFNSVTLYVGNYTIKMGSSDDGDFRWDNSNSEDLEYEDLGYEDDWDAYYVKIIIPVTQTQVNSGSVTAQVVGKWWRRGDLAEDQEINTSYTVGVSATRSPFNFDGYELTSREVNGEKVPAVKIKWKRAKNGNVRELGDIYLVNNERNSLTGGIAGDKIKADKSSDTEGDFYLIPINPISGNKNTNVSLDNYHYYDIKQSYVPTGNNRLEYLTYASSPILVKGYAQPENFKAEFLDNERKLKLTWTIEGAPAREYSQIDNFVISYKRKNAVGGVETTTGAIQVPYTPNQVSYSYEMDLDEGIDATFEFELYRSGIADNEVWRKAFTQRDTTTVNTHHIKVSNPTAELQPDNSVLIRWDVSGEVWSTGSSFVITRLNRTTSAAEDIVLSKKELKEDQYYVDEMIRLCNEYQYRLQVKPNQTYGAIPSVYTDENDNILATEKGELLGFTASKGYYSDRVVLEWERAGMFDEYAIERKEHGQDDIYYKKIITEENSGASTEYTVNDNTAEPGKIYDYRIIGLVQCADTILRSDAILTDIGFRTPTGDIYGRVTYENGQAEDSVEVYLESCIDEMGYSLYLDGNAASNATVTDASFLNGCTEATIQAWVRYTGKPGAVITKSRLYEVGFDSDHHLYFETQGRRITADSVFADKGSFVHISAVRTSNSISLYINGKKVKSSNVTFSGSNSNNSNLVIGGSLFAGYVDEIRIWSRALGDNEIKNDYNRYIVGNEENLEAYYSFNFNVDNSFYDLSHDQRSIYNEHHGILSNTIVSESIPTNEQLGYRAYTSQDGSYAIRAIPYIGGGTAYTIIPKRGIHQFQPEREDRYISAGAQSHTVNFTDISSFEVSGVVVYEGGTYPVQGVEFTIDGVKALDSRGVPFTTGSTGEFKIEVPVGTHEVKAVKDGHTFVLDGRITNIDGSDCNYQDRKAGVRLEDNTWVKYIGRVAGGTTQEAYTLGHGLSKNNLADNITVSLTHQYKGSTYDLVTTEYDSTFVHSLTNRVTGKEAENKVSYSEDGAVIHVNNTTGEFVALLRPEKYTLKINAKGYPTIPGNNSELNLLQAFSTQYETVKTSDSVNITTTDTIVNYDYDRPIISDRDTIGYEVIDTTFITRTSSAQVETTDSVVYNFKQKFIQRVKPEVDIVQKNSPEGNYYGEYTMIHRSLVDEIDTIALVDTSLPGSDQYLFKHPVFQQDNRYIFEIEVFEGYRYNGNSSRVDRVPTSDAKIDFINNIAATVNSTVECDSMGRAEYAFIVGLPFISDGFKNISATVTIGKDGSSTTFPWTPNKDNFADGKAFVVGGRSIGTDFVTAGPDRVLTVLRDPPGSGSYSYLEKGLTFNSSSTYTENLSNEGEEGTTLGASSAVYSWHGVGSGVMNVAIEADNGTTLGVKHEESYTKANTKSTSTTTTTRFQTSDSPEYVGADADVYVGYSTNLTFGATDNVAIISRKQFDADGGEDAYQTIYAEADEWVLVQKNGTNINQQFSTLFAYPQMHIINRLIPNLELLRNNFLTPISQFTEAQIEELQEIANQRDTTFYLTYFDASHPDFGKSNTDKTITDKSHGVENDVTNGPSYRIITKNDITVRPHTIVPLTDTILFLNNQIAAWEETIAQNEKAKLEAELLQNYSVHAGSPLEYSESYSAAHVFNSSFEYLVGVSVDTEVSLAAIGIKTGLQINETVSTTQTDEFESETERSHCKGFALIEEGTDYITVDVMKEKNSDDSYGGDDENDEKVDNDDIEELDYYPAFIFRTKGGLTSCPHEVERVTQYYQPGTKLDEATVAMEQPVISAEKSFLENVPSGEPARFTVYISNESEAKESVWMNLKIVDSSNPDGAKIYMDGSAIGAGRRIIAPSGEILTKTIEIMRGSALNYDNLQLVLESECQPSDETDNFDDIADTLTLSVHFIKSCTSVEIEKPAGQWTYNTALDTMTQDGILQHYMPVTLGGFDVNYPDFERIDLQYKASSEADNEYKTIISFFNDTAKYETALENGMNAQMISSLDEGKINYNWFMDNNFDQRYDLRAVSVCNIANQLSYSYSEIRQGIKDMYNPRLFGSAQPANGILTIEDELRLNFNETIADGYMTKNNFQITAVRNGTETDHSVAVRLTAPDSYMATDAVRNFTAKDITVEMWINADAQDAVLFSHGNVNDSISFGITADNHLFVTVNGTTTRSTDAFRYDRGSWAHVAMVLTAEGSLNLYYNFERILSDKNVGAYRGIGNMIVGRNIQGSGAYTGLIHNLRVWDVTRTMGELQLNANVTMSGNEIGLMLYCPMDEGRGTVVEDHARGANMAMYNCQWANPEGRSTMFDGSGSYVKLNTSAAVVAADQDFTIEFWFKAPQGTTSATMLSNGSGDGNELGGSDSHFAIGFDQNGQLTFTHNGKEVILNGSYADGSWHHIAVTAGRVQGRTQFYVDGQLNTYTSTDYIGSIAAAETFVGARGYYAPGNSVQLITDRHFKGSIDEIRIWNLYKTASVVTDQMYKRLDGNEMGLKAYYPFETYTEWQGNKVVTYSLTDAKKLADSTQKPATAEAVGQAVENADIAPILDKGPIANLNFNYVVNDDALIIILDEPYENIEKTIVTLTVTDVLDVNGNEILSPITWTAYIDRNQLKWSQNEWTDSKLLYDRYEFTVDIVNNGGSMINYTIENMPSWLSAEPSEGRMEPSSTQHVTFTVREDLNVGTYNEVIYLKNEDNVSEPLALNLTVVGDIPEWSVDPGKYRYNMSVFGKMRFNNIFSDDANDKIAAFYNGTCVGVANSVYNKDVDMWYAMLTVYGNVVNGAALTFRMWDASTGIIYEATPQTEQPITFRNNAIYGTPADPIVFDGQTVIYQDIALSKGWNWISFNLENANMENINAALASGNWRSGDQIKTIRLENGRIVARFADYSSSSKSWRNAHFALNNTNMFMLYTSVDQTLSLNGVLADPTKHPITLKAGVWNYIGFLSNMNLPVKTALAGYEAKAGDVVKSMDKFAMYSGNNWIGSLEYMEPSAGYMLLNSDLSDKTLTYPTTSTTISHAPAATTSSPYSLNMSVIAIGDMIEDGDRLYAVVDGDIRGEAIPVQTTRRGILQFVSVAGDMANENVVFILEKADGSHYTSTNRLPYAANTVTGTPDAPYVLHFTRSTSADAASVISVTPNPARHVAAVSLEMTEAAVVSVNIFDVSGSLIHTSDAGLLDAGLHTVEINVSAYPVGNYLVEVHIGDEIYVDKLIKQ